MYIHYISYGSATILNLVKTSYYIFYKYIYCQRLLILLSYNLNRNF